MDYKNTRVGGLSDKDIRSIASDNGVRLSYLDPLTSWVPDGLNLSQPPVRSVAGKLECPFVCKVEVSLWAAARHAD
ncbi:hypothetical protein ACC705_07080, partial [Rhizobium ruizarguesonis]